MNSPEEKAKDGYKPFGVDGYLATPDGFIYSLKRDKLLKGLMAEHYLRVSLMINNRRISKSVHRLIAIAHVPNPENKKEINHKDGNKINNAAYNLEWSTRLENVGHSIRAGLVKPKDRTNISIPVDQYDKGNNFIMSYASALEAARSVNGSSKWILACARGDKGVLSHKSFIWKIPEGGATRSKWKDGHRKKRLKRSQ